MTYKVNISKIKNIYSVNTSQKKVYFSIEMEWTASKQRQQFAKKMKYL